MIQALSAVFLVVACLWAMTGFCFVRKSSKRLPGLGWIMVGIIGLTCWHALVAGIVFLISIPVTAWVMGASDILLGCALWFPSWRQRKVQRYEFRVADLLAAAGMLTLAGAYFALRTAGLQFSMNFATIDPAPRIMEAVDVATRHSINAMYYHALTNGLLMDILGPITSLDYYYKVFVFSGGLFLVFVGLMFYSVIRPYLRKRSLVVVGAIVTMLYVGGYPLNATFYGFVYLGMGMAIVGYLVFVTDALMRDDISLWPAVALLMLGCLGMITCYAMFAPVMFIAVIWQLWTKQRQHGKLFTRETVLACLAVFLVPIALGMWYTYGGVFTAGVTMGGAISSEGAGYRELFLDYLPFVPLAVFGYLKCRGGKNLPTVAVILPVVVVFVVGLFGLGLLGKVSSYYYYKSYNLLWFVVMYLLLVGIVKIAGRETRLLVGIYAVAWALVFGLAMSGLDYDLSKQHPLFNPSDRSDQLNQIFVSNKVMIHSAGGIDPDQQALYHYVFDNITPTGDPKVPIVSYWQDAFWYQAISNQREHDWNEQFMTDPVWVMNMLRSTKPKYVVVLTGEASVTYQANKAYFDALPHVFATKSGFIAQLS